MNCKRLVFALLSLPILFSCEKEKPEPDPVVPKDPYKDYHIEHKVNGSTQSFLSNSGSAYNSESGSLGFPTTIDGVEYFHVSYTNCELVPDAGGNDGALISFSGYEDLYDTYVNNRAQALANICSLGSHAYIYDGNGEVDIEVYYNSSLYVSYLAPQPETSTFTITESTAITGSDTYFARNVKGTYSCRLYKVSNPSEFIDVTDGKFYLNFNAPPG